jgi:hypothetical protein
MLWDFMIMGAVLIMLAIIMFWKEVSGDDVNLGKYIIGACPDKGITNCQRHSAKGG